MKILPNGDSAFTIIFDEAISDELSLKIIALRKTLKKEFSKFLLDVIPAYQSLTLIMDIDNRTKRDLTADKIREAVTQHIENLDTGPIVNKSKLIKIPVCYHQEIAPDLEAFCEFTRLDLNQVIKLHTKPKYRVNMLGFLPGFLYLSGLDKKLFMPRKATPSLGVEAGSVGIGNNQTGVYPVNSPGGWQIIGKTPIDLFRPNNTDKFLVKPYDQIKFESISLNDYTHQVDSSKASLLARDKK